MPGGDGTGPAGAGPMTGRAAGYCAGNAVPGYMNPGLGGRGFFGGGWGFGGRGGGGWGRRNWFYATGLTGWQRAAQMAPAAVGPVQQAVPPTGAPVAPEQEIGLLHAQVQQAEAVLAGLKQRLEELGKSGVEKSPQ